MLTHHQYGVHARCEGFHGQFLNSTLLLCTPLTVLSQLKLMPSSDVFNYKTRARTERKSEKNGCWCYNSSDGDGGDVGLALSKTTLLERCHGPQNKGYKGFYNLTPSRPEKGPDISSRLENIPVLIRLFLTGGRLRYIIKSPPGHCTLIPLCHKPYFVGTVHASASGIKSLSNCSQSSRCCFY